MENFKYGQIVQEAHRAGVTSVVMEGPTVYLKESSRYPSQSWDSSSFRKGWEIAHNLSQMLDRNLRASIGHYVLIDDSLGDPANLKRDRWRPEAQTVVNDLRAQMRFPGFLSPGPVVMMESEFVQSSFYMDPYSSIDAAFQLVKLQDNLAVLDRLRVVIVHPETYQRQQQRMLSHLLGEMRRSGNFGFLTQAQRRSLVERSFRHIWIDSEGEEVGVTRPQWNVNNGLFDFVPMDELLVA